MTCIANTLARSDIGTLIIDQDNINELVTYHVPTRYTWRDWDEPSATTTDRYYYNSTSLRESIPLFAEKLGDDVPL